MSFEQTTQLNDNPTKKGYFYPKRYFWVAGMRTRLAGRDKGFSKLVAIFYRSYTISRF